MDGLPILPFLRDEDWLGNVRHQVVSADPWANAFIVLLRKGDGRRGRKEDGEQEEDKMESGRGRGRGEVEGGGGGGGGCGDRNEE